MSGPRVRRTVRAIQTPVGLARAHLWRPARPRGTVILGHGAGGLSWSGDLVALTSLASAGWLVVLVEQPWRVAGRKVATPPASLDVAWLAVMAELGSGRGRLPRPWVVGGRSSGARVACRTAGAVDADAVMALAFPLHPPGAPARSRAGEAALVTRAGMAIVVIQGARDPFGSPDEVRNALGTKAQVVAVAGTHSFTKNPADVVAAATTFLAQVG
jgi:predicted alpha/beta-hydrolase family hydrolase